MTGCGPINYRQMGICSFVFLFLGTPIHFQVELVVNIFLESKCFAWKSGVLHFKKSEGLEHRGALFPAAPGWGCSPDGPLRWVSLGSSCPRAASSVFGSAAPFWCASPGTTSLKADIEHLAGRECGQSWAVETKAWKWGFSWNVWSTGFLKKREWWVIKDEKELGMEWRLNSETAAKLGSTATVTQAQPTYSVQFVWQQELQFSVLRSLSSFLPCFLWSYPNTILTARECK